MNEINLEKHECLFSSQESAAEIQPASSMYKLGHCRLWSKTQIYRMEITLKKKKIIHAHQPGTCVVVRGGTRLSTVFFRGDGHAWTKEAGRKAMEGWGRNSPWS